LSFDELHTVASQNHCFRYEVHWERECSLQEEIQTSWKGQPRANDLGDIVTKLNSVKQNLQDWSKKTVGFIPGRIEKLRRDLERARRCRRYQNGNKIKKIESELDELLQREEIF
jgi:hypothetical protein